MTKQTAMSPPTNLWAVILVGEDGTGLQARTPGSRGDDRNKLLQAPFGIDSLLRQTLSRTRLAVPLERTVIVANRSHEIHLASEFPVPGAPRLVLRPRHRGTAADVLLAVHWIRRQEPDAVVVVLPSEQVVLEPFAFTQHVVTVARFVARHDREIVIVGARPTYPDTQYGWIETGQPIADTGCEPVWRVRSLRGNLSYPLARACYESGFLWNTFVIVARAETLLQASRPRLPELDTRLETVAALVGTQYEQRSVDEFYALAAEATFSEAVLAGGHQLLSASRLPPIHWSGRANPGPGLRPPEPRGPFDGLVEQYRLQANVDACRDKEAMSPDSPWRAAPREPAHRESGRRRVAGAGRRWNGRALPQNGGFHGAHIEAGSRKSRGSRLVGPRKDGRGRSEHPTAVATRASRNPERGNDRSDDRAFLPGQ